MSSLPRFSTIPELFQHAVDAYSALNRPAISQKTAAGVQALTHRELDHRVELVAHGLAALDVKKGDRIGIISENRVDWVVSDYSALLLGAVDVPVFPSLTAEQVRWIFADAGVSVVIVSNDFQLRKIRAAADGLPELKAIVVMTPGDEAAGQRIGRSAQSDPTDQGARLISLDHLLSLGRQHQTESPEYLATARATISPDDLATIIYTSGTTGTPKGVMLTHGNLTSNICSALEALPTIDTNDVILSYLPLCHSFERLASYFMFACGVQSTLAESIDKVAENLREVRPTIVTTVPRLLERMHGKIMKRMEGGPANKRRIFQWAIDTGRAFHRARRAGNISLALRGKMALADFMVFQKLHAVIGGRLRFFVSGGAALSKNLGEFFEAMGIIVLEGYGMTECSPVISVNLFGAQTFGTVGPPLPGVEVMIAPDGEILTRGPHVMRGYWHNDEATRETIDDAGWLHTGDVGEIDGHGNIRITDRKKHLFVSSGGKNIAPQLIEGVLMQSMYIDQLFLIGDDRPYVTALIVPEFEAVRTFAGEHGIPERDATTLIANPEITALFQRELDRLQRDLANFERVRKFTLLPAPFTIEAGELTPTMKIKRKVVMEKYREWIDGMYK